MTESLFFIFILIASSIGFIVSMILLFGQSISTLGSKLLAGILLSMVITASGNSLALTDFYLQYPHYFKIFNWVTFCIGPLTYLYIRTVLNQSYRLFKKDLLLFIPALSYQIHRLSYDLLPIQEKLILVKRAIENRIEFVNEPEGLLPPGWIAIYRVTVLLVSIIAAFYLLINWHKKIYTQGLQIERNKQIYQFLWVAITLLFSGTIIVFIFTFIQVFSGYFMARLIVFSVALEIILICAYLFAQPKILYGMIGWIQLNEPIRSIENSTSNSTPVDEESEDDVSYISYHNGKNILTSIENHFLQNHPFTTIGYCLSDLSREINVPAYLVSAVINQEFDKNFNEFINDARIQYISTMRENDENFDKYSIEYIGTSLGFGSRTSFITAVKKRTGLLPKEYLASMSAQKA